MASGRSENLSRQRRTALNAKPRIRRRSHSGSTCDAIIIGGGFYGCETALELGRLGFEKVVLVEREPGLLRRASFVNQARIHNGYHYPRAYATALKSRRHFETFVDEYRHAVMHDMEMYYAIAKGSRVTIDQFQAFSDQIGAFCRPASRDVEILFEPGMIDRAFQVRELAFDLVKIEQQLSKQLLAAGIELRLEQSARIVGLANEAVEIEVSGGLEWAPWVFNCTYAELETVGVPIRTGIKKELAEMILISAAAAANAARRDGDRRPVLLDYAVPGIRASFAFARAIHPSRGLGRSGGFGRPAGEEQWDRHAA